MNKKICLHSADCENQADIAPVKINVELKPKILPFDF